MSQRPNILFVMTDQQRWDAMGCVSDGLRTPHMDALAAEGVRFTNCFTPSPVCISARLSLATGWYPHSTGVWNNCEHTMAPETQTWMQAVRDQGYRTSLFGKTHLHPHKGDLRDREDLMHAYGLDDLDEIGGPRASTRLMSHMTERWQKLGLLEAYREDYRERFANKPHVARPSVLPLEEYADTYVGRRANEYLRDYDRDEPWFCWVSFGGPHEPWDSPEPYHSMYAPADMPPAVPRFVDTAERASGALDRRFASEGALTQEDIAAMRADYAGNVSLIDDQIGALVETIRARGEWEQTLVVFTSDHGEMNGDHGLIYKSQMLNGAVRVPLVIRTPETVARGGGLNDAPTEMFDIGPTMVEAAGGRLDYEQFARSLGPVLNGSTGSVRADALSEIDGEVMLCDGRWKTVLNDAGQPYLLFDLHEDPDESQNLAGNPRCREVQTALQLRAMQRVMAAQVRRERWA